VRLIYVNCYREFTGSNTYGAEPMTHWDGGVNPLGTRRQNIWPRIAAHLVSHGLEPFSFIRAQFWSRTKTTRPPPPNYLLSSEALTRYRTYQEQGVSNARKDYETHLLMVQGEVLLMTRGLGWEYQRALRYALFNVSTVTASPLFRYCLAFLEGLADVAAHFHDQALLTYVFQKELLDAAWAEKIPAPLRQEGEGLRQRILGGR